MPYPAPAVPGYVDKSTVITAAEMNWLDQQARSAVSLSSFAGADPTGTTDSTAALMAALASLSPGGALRIPAGTWRIQRGYSPDNILVGGVLIFGDGPATQLVGYNQVGAQPNDAGNENYNVFAATGLSNITIRDLSLSGYCGIGSFISCTNITLSGIHDNGLGVAPGYWLRDKSAYFYKCTNVLVWGCHFVDVNFPVYLSGDITTKTTVVNVESSTFEHQAAAFTALFPAQVYCYFAGDVVVQGNMFKRIYTSDTTADPSVGVGYGVYEGDGDCGDIMVANNHFLMPAFGNHLARTVFTTTADSFMVTGNTFTVAALAKVSHGVLASAETKNSILSIQGNTFNWDSTSYNAALISVATNNGVTTSPVVTITGNVCVGGGWGIHNFAMGNGKFEISGNILSGQTGPQIQLQGETTRPHKFPLISNNHLSGGGLQGILLNGCVIGAVVTGNTILDGNQTNTASTSAIESTSFSSVGLYAGNLIANTVGGGGKFTWALDAVSGEVDRIFKTIVGQNTLLGVFDSAASLLNNAAPANSAYDIQIRDYFSNSAPASGTAPGWYCTFHLSTTLTGDASSSSATIGVASNAGVAGGDVIFLCKAADPISTGYYADTTKWHVDTVAGTGAGTITLTSGIPAGDGTYSSATSIVRVYRTKAAASIA